MYNYIYMFRIIYILYCVDLQMAIDIDGSEIN